jgi:hypothetical protein
MRHVYVMETLSTRVEPSTKEQVEEYADESGETQSVATRELLRAGIEAEGYARETDHTTEELLRAGLESKRGDESVPLLVVVQMLGWVLLAGAFVDTGPVLGYIGVALVLGTVLEQRFGVVGI